jgi:AcrR family transcriptional regulator
MSTGLTADETRSRILREAERLFRHYGYSKTTVAEIASACGMSSANVYRFFGSKSDINEAICDRIISDLEAQLHKIAISDAPASIRLTEFIELIGRHTVETLIEEKKVHDMVVVAMEENWGAIERHLQLTEVMIADIIASGVASGEFKKVDVPQTAKCVHCAIACLKHPVVVAQCRGDPNVATPSEMASFVLSALKA